MEKVKIGQLNKKDQIERILINMWKSQGMDIPSNYEEIVQYCYEDVCETADAVNWSVGDVAIAFRRWIEEQITVKKINYSALTNVLNNLTEESEELIAGGNSNEKAEGQAILRAVTAIKHDIKLDDSLYFKIINQGIDEDLHREQVEINCGDYGKTILIKTDEGFIIDIYGNDDHYDSMTVWEEDIAPDDEE